MTQADALSCTSSFTPLRWRKFLQQNRLKDDPEGEFPKDLLPNLILADTIYKIPGLEPEQYELLLGFWADGLEKHGADGFLLGIVDGRFACCSGIQGWLDLKTGKDVKKIPAMKTSTAFNFTNIMRHAIGKKTERSGV